MLAVLLCSLFLWLSSSGVMALKKLRPTGRAPLGRPPIIPNQPPATPRPDPPSARPTANICLDNTQCRPPLLCIRLGCQRRPCLRDAQCEDFPYGPSTCLVAYCNTTETASFCSVTTCPTCRPGEGCLLTPPVTTAPVVPQTDAPTTPVPMTDTPTPAVPQTDAPTLPVPVTDAPTPDAPLTDAPTTPVTRSPTLLNELPSAPPLFGCSQNSECNDVDLFCRGALCVTIPCSTANASLVCPEQPYAPENLCYTAQCNEEASLCRAYNCSSRGLSCSQNGCQEASGEPCQENADCVLPGPPYCGDNNICQDIPCNARNPSVCQAQPYPESACFFGECNTTSGLCVILTCENVGSTCLNNVAGCEAPTPTSTSIGTAALVILFIILIVGIVCLCIAYRRSTTSRSPFSNV